MKKERKEKNDKNKRSINENEKVLIQKKK